MKTEQQSIMASATTPHLDHPSSQDEELKIDDIEQQAQNAPEITIQKVPAWRIITRRMALTPDIVNHPYKGSGTEDDPYIVDFIPHDSQNPMEFSPLRKAMITGLVAMAALAVAFVSSAYSGPYREVMEEFHVREEVFLLGISLFVLGFAIGPLVWAPLSELYGRQIIFILTYAALTAFNAGAAGAQSMATLLVLRFLAGVFGSSPLSNAGGVIADIYCAEERGIGLAVFAAAPFLGPVIGPIVGGFVGETIGWRWCEGIMAIFTGSLWILGSLLIPETYAPLLLQKRAASLAKLTGKVYVPGIRQEENRTPKEIVRISLLRPWALLFLEPIVLLISIYMAIIYGTLYLCFGAFPIVFQEYRGWSEGIGGLAFLGVAVGMILGIVYCVLDNRRFVKVEARLDGEAPPEARLPPAMVGSISIPVGLFWFAWTNAPSVHWSVSIIATAPFGFGMVLVFMSCMNYLIDAYTIYAASVLGANSLLRSLFGTAFPLFTTAMFRNLGIHWASSVPAFLAVACTPFPFIFYKYGAAIRMKCRYAAKAEKFAVQAREQEKRLRSQQGIDEDSKETSS